MWDRWFNRSPQLADKERFLAKKFKKKDIFIELNELITRHNVRKVLQKLLDSLCFLLYKGFSLTGNILVSLIGFI